MEPLSFIHQTMTSFVTHRSIITFRSKVTHSNKAKQQCHRWQESTQNEMTRMRWRGAVQTGLNLGIVQNTLLGGGGGFKGGEGAQILRFFLLRQIPIIKKPKMA